MSETYKAPTPNSGEPWDVAIIGSGPAALTSAVYTTRGAASTLLLAGAAWGGQLMLTTTVDNFPGFPEGIDGPVLMERMRAQAERFGANIVVKDASFIDVAKKPFEIKAGEDIYKAKSIIVATGASTKWLGVPGEETFRGRGVSSCAPCDAPFFKGKEVAVVGGGDSAMEEAITIAKYASHVTVIHRRDQFKASHAMQTKVLSHPAISVLWDSEVVEIKGDDRVKSIVISTKKASKKTTSIQGRQEGENILWEKPMEGVFVAIGHVPSTSIFKSIINLDEKGYIVKEIKEGFDMATSVDGVFVAGDVHDLHHRQAITAAGYGCMAAIDVLRYLDKDTPSW